MEREVAEAVRIGVAMVMIAALLFIVNLTVYIGNGVKSDAAETSIDYANTVASSQISDLSHRENIVLPKAAAYSLVATEYKYISSIEYLYNGNMVYIEPGSDKDWVATTYSSSKSKLSVESYASIEGFLKEDLSGKVLLNVKSLGDGTFKLLLEDYKY